VAGARRLPAETLAAIEWLRRERLTGPAIARTLGLARSTVGAVLRLLGLGRLSALELKPPAIRYERQHPYPGELIPIDTKKLGRIDGVGHRITGDRRGQSSKRGTGWEMARRAARLLGLLGWDITPSCGTSPIPCEGSTPDIKRA
jgi:hypothetical protein